MKALLKYAYLINDINEIQQSINHFKRKRFPEGYINDIKTLQSEQMQCLHEIKGARIVLQQLFSEQTLDYIEEHAKTLLIAYTNKKEGE